jgi:predicted nucleic acid-binding protein
MAEIEISAIEDTIRQRRVLQLLPERRMLLDEAIFDRARHLIGLGIDAADAVHLAAAESLQSNVFLTCDDRLLRRCGKIVDELKVQVFNPVEWLKGHADATKP